ncbi:Hpt domain-containing protein, partial [Luteimonas sp. gir]|uniref:Hpt domain-containing protein n=1 Tax=Luteimonas sp. gir TaxID=3127960 RepID=UPI003075D17C
MQFSPDIAADFVLEARELLVDLGGQLVELEQSPDDREQLNAVFRAFHTLKGGAGFLGATALVELCHAAEETLGAARSGAATLLPRHFDAAQQSLDWLQAMVDAVETGSDVPHAPPELIAGFALDTAAPVAPGPAARAAPTVAAPSAAGGEMIDDDEFEALLDQLHGNAAPGASAPAPAPGPNDPIDDDEFEALLDQLHGKAAPGATPVAAAPAAGGDTIDDDEFEALLDQLHGA